jgi:hypothetical protein
MGDCVYGPVKQWHAICQPLRDSVIAYIFTDVTVETNELLASILMMLILLMDAFVWQNKTTARQDMLLASDESARWTTQDALTIIHSVAEVAGIWYSTSKKFDFSVGNEPGLSSFPSRLFYWRLGVRVRWVTFHLHLKMQCEKELYILIHPRT